MELRNGSTVDVTPLPGTPILLIPPHDASA